MNPSFLSNSFIGKKVAISLYKIPMLWVNQYFEIYSSPFVLRILTCFLCIVLLEVLRTVTLVVLQTLKLYNNFE